jgi:hypothetical protein
MRLSGPAHGGANSERRAVDLNNLAAHTGMHVEGHNSVSEPRAPGNKDVLGVADVHRGDIFVEDRPARAVVPHADGMVHAERPAVVAWRHACRLRGTGTLWRSTCSGERSNATPGRDREASSCIEVRGARTVGRVPVPPRHESGETATRFRSILVSSFNGAKPTARRPGWRCLR